MKIPSLIDNKKEIYGTYIPMALMNIQTVLDDIRKKAGIKTELKENFEDYWEHPVLDENDMTAEQADYVMKRLGECFPFLGIMGENQRTYYNKKAAKDKNPQRAAVVFSDMSYCLKISFRVLKAYRDYTTHYKIYDNKFEDGSKFLTKSETPLSSIINDYYTVALRMVKDRYTYTPDDMKFMSERYKKTNENGKRKMVLDYAFPYSLVSQNEDKTGKQHLSAYGVALLACLFLEKQYINLFFDKLGFGSKYPKHPKRGQIARRSFSICSVRLPKRINVSKSKDMMTVALDMINELKRCPRELYDVLPPERQNRFRSISSDHNEVLLVRSTDRFAQCLLQYIDYGKMFKKVRFHVNMGKLRYLFNAEKTCIDGNKRVRVLEHLVNAFGRIQELEDCRKDNDGNFVANNGAMIKVRGFGNVERDDANPDNYPYMVDTYAHYMLDNNKVEMLFCDDNMLPDIELYGGKWYVNNIVPSCRMSVFELPAMAFHMHLLGAEQTEKRLVEVYGSYVRLFKAMNEGTLTKENIHTFGIDEKDMPKQVLDCINGVRHANGGSYHAALKKKLHEMAEETDRLLCRLKEDRKAVVCSEDKFGNVRYDNKMGKKMFRRISPGRVAAFLAEDIVRFQPTERDGEDYGTDRLTGMNYRVMQAAIAVYNSNNAADGTAFDDFCAMFRNAGLVGGGSKQHPFLENVLNGKPQDTVDFYEKYLIARKRHIANQIKEIEGRTIDTQYVMLRVPFFNKDKSRWMARDKDYYSDIAREYLEEIAVELPRQMFDDDIKTCLKSKPEMSDIDFNNANVTYLIAEYMRRMRKDTCQEFYEWKRNYKYMDMLIKDVRSGKLAVNYTDIDEREKLWQERDSRKHEYRKWAIEAKKKQRGRKDNRPAGDIVDDQIARNKNEYEKNERAIRRYKVQDALMFLMANDVLQKSLNINGEKFKVNEIMPDADKGILSEVMSVDFEFKVDGKICKIHADNMKIKNYGDLFVIVNDKRFGPMLKILGTDKVVTLNKDEVETEFKNYNDGRSDVVKLILNFEKSTYETYPDILEDFKKTTAEGGRYNFNSLLMSLQNRGCVTEETKQELRLIRNAFEHNSYPEPYPDSYPDSYPDKKYVKIRVKTLPEIAKDLVKKLEERTSERKDK
ncbi:MAG: type VI-B CRISPR-associated RNA-guided ribonuclease Cas13b [Prevotella sp.]|nr:type VI-B CRISPR-associated RNA-guided ribonuclease Cas13b [Prevotella sp.]